MKVFVISQEGTPLMPTTPRRARIWLKAKRAHIIRQNPFTIGLHFATQEYVQRVNVGVDTGSQTVGIAATSNGEVVVQAEIHLRNDITNKMTQRRQYRRNRRNRKTRYRAARFANRGRPAGWLPPSLHSKAESTIKAVHFVASLLPIHQIIIEVGSFDTQKIQNPEISGISYQQGELQGYLVREYVLGKWKRQCSYCHVTGVPLQLEHIVPRSRGGSNRVSNLALACKPCNVKKSTLTAEEFGYPQIQAQAKKSLKDAAHVSSIKTAIISRLCEQFGQDKIHISYGYETKYKRIQVLALPKSHTNDAIAIACGIGERVTPLETIYQMRCLARGQYQRFNGSHSEHKCWSPRKVRGWKLYEVVKVKGEQGFIAGRREKGAFVIKDVTTGKKLAEISPKKMERVARPIHGWIITRQPITRHIGKEGGASSPS